jgi:hypothetical protein
MKALLRIEQLKNHGEDIKEIFYYLDNTPISVT